MIKNVDLRKWHRELGYFFVGLIVSFAISGIAQNHRKTWDPEKYVYSSLLIQTQLNQIKNKGITVDDVQKVLTEQNKSLILKDFRIGDRGSKLRAFFTQGIADIDLNTGLGKIELLDERPLIGPLAKLHKSDQYVWKWYSDIFALGLIFISFSGLFLVKGKNSFKSRGYIFMLAGIIVPLFFLFFL